MNVISRTEAVADATRRGSDSALTQRTFVDAVHLRARRRHRIAIDADSGFAVSLNRIVSKG